MTPPAAVSQVLKSNVLKARKIQIRATNNELSNVQPRRNPMDVLEENVAFGALHDSSERFDPPKCHPKTRTAVIDHVDSWARGDSNDSKPILWLSGAAGSGKSAIAQTLVEKWVERGICVLSFFFWRTRKHCNHKLRLAPTIAFQLLTCLPSLRANIEQAISENAIFHKTLRSQFEELIIKPLATIDSQVVIVIEGLDECVGDLPHQDHENQQQEILEAITSACQKCPSIRFLVSSRPERQIRESFADGFLKDHTLSLSLKDAKDVTGDIRLFLGCKFEEIRRRHGLDPSWPSTDQLDRLVRKSSGQFIYPAVVVKHVGRHRGDPDPVRDLREVLELQPSSMWQRGNPLAELDTLYDVVLHSIRPESRSIVMDILGYISYPMIHKPALNGIFSHSVANESPSMFEKLFFLSDGCIYSHLTDLHSLLDIPPRTKYDTRPIHFMHATFSEYLVNQYRSGDFYRSFRTVRSRFTLLLLEHVRRLDLNRTNTRIYNTANLIRSAGAWAYFCQPMKPIKDDLWVLMKAELGSYPFTRWSLTSSRHYKKKDKEQSIQFVIHLERCNGKLAILKYLEECNIPAIESSWWRRIVIHHRLKAAMSREERGKELEKMLAKTGKTGAFSILKLPGIGLHHGREAGPSIAP